VTTSPGTIRVTFNPPPTTEPIFAPSHYAYSVDDGAHWATPDPATTASPIVIAGLDNYHPYPVRIRAWNTAGPGDPSAAVTSVIRVEPPRNLVASSIVANRVTLRWDLHTSGIPPTAYELEGGLNPGEVLASVSTGGIAPVFSFSAPSGAFYVRLHALAGSVRSEASNEIRIVVNMPEPPSAPANLLGVVNGSDIALSWTNTFAGGAPSALWLHVSGTITATLPLPMGDMFTAANVPSGTYTLRVSASNASGASSPSNAVTLHFPEPCTGVPLAPTNLQTWTVGTVVFVAWSPPASGPAVTGYTVGVGGAHTGSFATAARTLSGAAVPGTYVLSLTGNNACGTGPATPPQTVIVP
jgi:hypothetical protein